jgi:hypothetical protein
MLSHNFSNSGQKTARQLPGSGRPLKSKDFDDALAVWVRSQRQKKLCVSRQMILKEAQRTARLYFDDEEEETSFKVKLSIIF